LPHLQNEKLFKLERGQNSFMKKTCVECRASFEAKLDDLEEGDAINCPECNLEFTIIADKKGKLKLIESKELEMEESEEEEDEEAEEDFEEGSE